jgi:hypothetical protein
MNRLRSLARIIVGILRELGDEGPYHRYLETHGRQHSPEEWRRFCKERLGAKYQRPKCC